MGKKSRRARGGGRRGTPTSINSKAALLTRHLLEDDEKIKKEYADGTLTVSTLRIAEPTLRTAVAAALGVDEEGIAPAVKATLLMYLDEFTDKEDEAAKRRAPPPPPASESVAGPWCKARGPQAQRIAIALAMAKAAAKDVTPKEKSSENTRFSTALFALRDAIVTDEDDEANFDEYMYSHYLEGMEAEQYVKAVARWPRLRKHWPRMRRRICSYCGKRSDPSEPRLLVCGGCGEGRGVGRYCSEECQRAHWPVHQESCMKYHEYTGKAHQFVETKKNREGLQSYYNKNRAEGRTVTPDDILKSCLRIYQ